MVVLPRRWCVELLPMALIGRLKPAATVVMGMALIGRLKPAVTVVLGVWP